MRQWEDNASAAQPYVFGLPKFNKLYPRIGCMEPLFVVTYDRRVTFFRFVIQLLSQSYIDAPSAKQGKNRLCSGKP